MEKIAIISVSYKDGIVEFALALIALGWRIISTGGTGKVLREAGIEVTEVSEISGFSEMLKGRVKTLVPHIHGGLLAMENQLQELEEQGYPWIDLACIDFYPLEEEIRKPEATYESVTEETDIGGPTMVRSGAKGHRIVIADPKDREMVIQWLKDGEPDGVAFRRQLAAKAETAVAKYCLASAHFLSEGVVDGMIGTEVRVCKYGENAWQTPASQFTCDTGNSLALDKFELVGGGEPSHNNLCDMDRLLQTITHIAAGYDVNGMLVSTPCIAVVVKHRNACGAAVAEKPIDALEKMIEGNPLAVHGGMVMTNFPIGEEEAACLRRWNMAGEGKRLIDGVFAPWFSDKAELELKRKEGKCPLLANLALSDLDASTLDDDPIFIKVCGGFLRQPNYTFVLNLNDPEIECVGAPLSPNAQRDIVLAWGVGSTSNSNTITIVKNSALIGNGTGQQDRVGAAELSVKLARRSGHDTCGAVGYSDSFFPFADGPKVLIEAGVKAIFASKGARRDEEIREVCRAAGVTLYLIPDKKGRGFFH